MLRRTSRALKSLRTSRIVASVRPKSPVAPFSTSFTSNIVQMLSLTRRTTVHSFSAISGSPNWACTGSNRFSRVKAWCKALNSVSKASVSPVRSNDSIMDSIARSAEGDDALASALEGGGEVISPIVVNDFLQVLNTSDTRGASPTTKSCRGSFPSAGDRHSRAVPAISQKAGAALAGVDRVAGPVDAGAGPAAGKVNVGEMGEGASKTLTTSSPSEARVVNRRATRVERAGMSPKMASLNRYRGSLGGFGHGNGYRYGWIACKKDRGRTGGAAI
eukprot:1635852-Pleurochrysis_carterae.AAC.2